MRAARSATLAVALALVSAGTSLPAPAQTPAPMTSAVRTLAFGGRNRTYLIVRPARTPANPALVMVLHGGYGTAKAAEEAYGWDALAARRGFVVVYPQGIGRSWNGGSCCGPARDQGVDDVGFLGAVIRETVERDGVEPGRVYVTGMSNGAIMAYRFACEAAVPPSAIGPVAGALDVACPAPRARVSVLAIHGSADRNVPFAGGIGSKGTQKVAHTSLEASLDRWRWVDGCAPAVTSREGAITAERSACRAGTAVELLLIDGAGHQWPGAKPRSAIAMRLLDPDPPSTALDATVALWAFFEAHPAPAGETSATGR